MEGWGNMARVEDMIHEVSMRYDTVDENEKELWNDLSNILAKA